MIVKVILQILLLYIFSYSMHLKIENCKPITSINV